MEKRKNIRKAAYQVYLSIKEKFPKINEIHDVEKELDYYKKVIAVVKNEPTMAKVPAVRES